MRGAALVMLCAGGAAAIGDLQRTRAKVPRDAFRSPFFYHMGKTLNGHLTRAHPNTVPCHKWSAADLQKLQATLLTHREEAHDQIYKEAGDPRALLRTTDEHRAHWDDIDRAAAGHRQITEMQRDGHCHEAVMWWIHHLSHETRQKLRHLAIPTLPLVEWRKPVADEGAAAAKVYGVHYHPSSTCQACHAGGLPWQDPDVQPPPYPRQVNNMDRVRRCEEWYGAEEGGVCDGCEGIAGAYYGDMPDEGIYPACEIVANASDVPVAERAPSSFPKAFAVEMRGADRWPRASAGANASCNYTTDCEPYGDEGVPIPPGAGFHWYAPIHGVLYLDHNRGGQMHGGRLRHETVYQFPSGRAGAQNALRGHFGQTNVHLTEIHVQSDAQAAKDDPGVMLNLEHTGMDALNKSGVDDSKLDWRRIPSSDGMCVCVGDPAGLPNFMGAYSNATYKGRVRFSPPWQTTGTGAPPTDKPIVADHWVKWTFHLFTDIDTFMPAMFSSPFGGCATYGNWTIMPDALWPEWRVNPSQCVDVKNNPDCGPWTPPPAPQ